MLGTRPSLPGSRSRGAGGRRDLTGQCFPRSKLICPQVETSLREDRASRTGEEKREGLLLYGWPKCGGLTAQAGYWDLAVVSVISIWNSQSVYGDACSPVKGNSERGMRAGAGGGSGLSVGSRARLQR